VTVTGVADADAADETVTISHTIAGNDYAAVSSANVTASVTDDDEIFASVVIGAQTWSASNVSLVPTAYNSLGVHYWEAYEGSHGAGSAADEDGFYYTWDAAMNVCPSGWRLPSDTDWKILEGALGMSVTQQELTGWRGTDAEGTKLKVGGTSPFQAKLPGYLHIDGNFYNRGELTAMWSSTTSGDKAYMRYLEPGQAKVHRNPDLKTRGFNVRCLNE
jgi:uncharacterized protein (TIGR02145 family)